jgi:bacteriocin-like protein
MTPATYTIDQEPATAADVLKRHLLHSSSTPVSKKVCASPKPDNELTEQELALVSGGVIAII